jgi:soluble lytic murein transglycosylase-like protein
MMALIASAILSACAPTAETMRAVERVDPLLVRSVIANESTFDPHAVSPAGAIGLGQLMPSTAAGLGVCNSFDVTQNVLGSALYLRELLDRFHGDLRLVIASYNAGPNAVAKYGDVPPFSETQTYVRRVLGTYAGLTHGQPPASPAPTKPVPRVSPTPRPTPVPAGSGDWGAP